MTKRSGELLVMWAALVSCCVVACRRERATPEACGEILDRIVEIELNEQGFRDASLARRKKLEMRRLFEPDLRRCAGGKLRPDALACVKSARTTEEIAHVCLR